MFKFSARLRRLKIKSGRHKKGFPYRIAVMNILGLRKEYPWKIVSIEEESGLTSVITLEPKFNKRFTFLPGQGAFFNFPKIRGLWKPRFFHFTSAPASAPVIEITVKAVDDWTHRVSLLEEGDIALCSKATGNFLGHEDFSAREKRFVFFAGGIGINPFISILSHLALTNSNCKILLIWSANNREDLYHKETLKNISETMPFFNIIPFLTHDPMWKGEKSRISEDKLRILIPEFFGFNEDSWLWDGPATGYWINGPASFSEEIKNILKRMGVSSRNIRVEKIRK